jgi:hypothetical protein
MVSVVDAVVVDADGSFKLHRVELYQSRIGLLPKPRCSCQAEFFNMRFEKEFALTWASVHQTDCRSKGSRFSLLIDDCERSLVGDIVFLKYDPELSEHFASFREDELPQIRDYVFRQMSARTRDWKDRHAKPSCLLV